MPLILLRVILDVSVSSFSMFSGEMPMPLSVTDMCRTPALTQTRIVMRPVRPLGSMPLKMAFSTMGCSVSLMILAS